jgi:hypothetical protein
LTFSTGNKAAFSIDDLQITTRTAGIEYEIAIKLPSNGEITMRTAGFE